MSTVDLVTNQLSALSFNTDPFTQAKDALSRSIQLLESFCSGRDAELQNYRGALKIQNSVETALSLASSFKYSQDLKRQVFIHKSIDQIYTLITTSKARFDILFSELRYLDSALRELLSVANKIYSLELVCLRLLNYPLDETSESNPFPNIFRTDDQEEFNITFHDLLPKHLDYVEKNRDKLKSSSFRMLLPEEAGLVWPIAIFNTSNIYLNFGLSIDTDDEGSYKTVKAAYSLTKKKTVAKLTTTIYLNTSDDVIAKSKQSLENEEKFLRLCKEKSMPNIVEIYDCVTFTKRTKEGLPVFRQVIYEEFCPNGTLFESRSWRLFTPEKTKKILYDILKGVSCLHDAKIVHRDLKDHNIFLARDDTPRIADFGFACFDNEFRRDVNCSPMFCDPSTLQQMNDCGSATHKCEQDIWSVGVIMYLYLFSVTDVPWTVDASPSTLPRLIRKKRDYLFPKPSETDLYKSLCHRMLQIDPKKRPTAKEALDILSLDNS